MHLALLALLPLITAASAQAHGESYAQTMGPVAFMWPPDRPWSETEENIAPCGSSASVSNRTDFPLTGGNLLLVAQDDAWAVEIAISYKANPTSINDFSPWFKTNVTAELDSAHTCYSAPDIPSSVNPGDVGTIQLIYNAEDGSKNVSHFACADVRFVELSAFRASGYSVFCFNTTEDEAAPDGTPSSVSYASGSATTLSVASTAAAAAASSTSSSSNAAYSNFGVSGVLALFAGAVAAVV